MSLYCLFQAQFQISHNVESLTARVAELERRLTAMAAASPAASDVHPQAALRPALEPGVQDQGSASSGSCCCSGQLHVPDITLSNVAGAAARALGTPALTCLDRWVQQGRLWPSREGLSTYTLSRPHALQPASGKPDDGFQSGSLCSRDLQSQDNTAACSGLLVVGAHDHQMLSEPDRTTSGPAHLCCH